MSTWLLTFYLIHLLRLTSETSPSVIGQFENSLKTGLGDYETLDISVTTEQSCDMGQVLSQGSCGKCNKFNMLPMTGL